MSDVDTIRSDLFKSEGAFVDKLQDADKTAPALHDEAVVRLNAVFKYASVEGRKRFLEEMKIPGAWREARLVYETCLKGGGTEEECQEAQAKVKTFRPIFEAWPSANTVARRLTARPATSKRSPKPTTTTTRCASRNTGTRWGWRCRPTAKRKRARPR